MNDPSNESQQTRAYDRMMERVKSTLEQAERDAMPPLGRVLVDNVGVKLIAEWIDSLPENRCL